MDVKRLFNNYKKCSRLFRVFSLINWLDVVGRSLSVCSEVATNFYHVVITFCHAQFRLKTFSYFGLSHDKAGHVFENFEPAFQ